MSIIIPPIKSQGIKTKLVPWILDLIESSGLDLEQTNWIEPFLGTGVVGLNIPVGGKRIVGDTNPHIINFYNALKDGEITPLNMRSYLEFEGVLLSNSGKDGYEHYRKIRDRFNQDQSPFDFLFLSRAGFNGMMRFNKMGYWNIPFCKKPNRFSPAYITKICNQIAAAERIIKGGKWEFCHQDFVETIHRANKGDYFRCSSYSKYLCQLNSYAAIRKGGHSIPSYRLNNIGKRELNDEKLDYSEDGDIKTLSRRNYKKCRGTCPIRNEGNR